MIVSNFSSKILVIFVCAILLSVELSCFQDSSKMQLSGPITITSEWAELQHKSPLKVENDLQVFVFDLESPLRYDFYKEGKGPNKGRGILMPDGEVINPEIQVIDQYGNIFNLVWSGARQTFSPAYTLPSGQHWPSDREYRIIRIRSPKPIRCKAIYWICESSKDLK